MKKLIVLITAIFTAFSISMAQTDNPKSEKKEDHQDKKASEQQDKKATEQQDEMKSYSGSDEFQSEKGDYTKAEEEVSGDVKDFIDDAARGFLFQIELAQIAIQNEDVPKEIVKFGQNVVEDHTQANLDLKGIAGGMEMDMPVFINPDDIGIEHQKELNEFKELEDARAWENYMLRMESDHRALISEFEKAQVGLENEEINAWIDETLPVLKAHLHKAQDLQAKISAGELVEEKDD